MRTALCLVLFLFVNVGWAEPRIEITSVRLTDKKLGIIDQEGVIRDKNARWPYVTWGAPLSWSTPIGSCRFYSTDTPDNSFLEHEVIVDLAQSRHRCKSRDGNTGQGTNYHTNADAGKTHAATLHLLWLECNQSVCSHTQRYNGYYMLGTEQVNYHVIVKYNVYPDVNVTSVTVNPSSLDITGYEWAETTLTATHDVSLSGGSPAEIDVTAREALLMRVTSGSSQSDHKLDAGVKKTIATQTKRGFDSSWKLAFRFPDGSLKPGPTRSFPVTITYRYL